MISPARLIFASTLGIAMVLPIVGCDRSNSSGSKTPAPATIESKPSGAQPTVADSRRGSSTKSRPATTQVATCTIWIDERPATFPAAKLSLKNTDEGVVALLFSDDPLAAIDRDYSGNSFYLEMKPDVGDDNTLAGSTWDFKAADSERSDSLDGLYLQGRKIRLQPFDVHIEFESSKSPVTVLVRGQFLQFDEDSDSQNRKLVNVHAELKAEIGGARKVPRK